MTLRLSRNSTRECLRILYRAKTWLIVFVLAPMAISCAHRTKVYAPPCPAPSTLAVDQFEVIVSRPEEFEEFIYWISRIDQYCRAIDNLE